MSDEPQSAQSAQSPQQDLNSVSVEAIARRIDTYDQAWEKRIDKLMPGIERLETTAHQIARKVDEITDFIGTATEQQKAVELRIMDLSEQQKADELRIMNLEEKIDARFAQMSVTIDGMVQSTNSYQVIAQEQAKATQALGDKIDARFEQMSVTIDSMLQAINGQQTIAQEQARVTQSLSEKIDTRFDQMIRTTDHMAQSINGYQEIAREQAKTTQELIRLVTVMAGKTAA